MGYYETNSSWSNGIALGLGALVSHDNSGSNNNYAGNGSPAGGLKPGVSPGNSFHHSHPLSREGSIMETSSSEDVDSTRCFPFGFRFGFGRSRRNNNTNVRKNRNGGEDFTVSMAFSLCFFTRV